MPNLTEQGLRGCGERQLGAAYLCLGTSPFGTLKVEDLILDHPIPFDESWLSRGVMFLPQSEGSIIHDVYMLVDSQAYPLLWAFVEEARQLGISKRIPTTFKFDKLVPGYTKVKLIFRRGIPKFDFEIDSDEHLSHCKMFGKMDQPINVAGHHLEKNDYQVLRSQMGIRRLSETFCTYAHQHLDIPVFENFSISENLLQAVFPEDNPFSTWKGYSVKIDGFEDDVKAQLLNKENWEPAICMEFTLSHVEISQQLNKENVATMASAYKAGYEVIVTEW